MGNELARERFIEERDIFLGKREEKKRGVLGKGLLGLPGATWPSSCPGLLACCELSRLTERGGVLGIPGFRPLVMLSLFNSQHVQFPSSSACILVPCSSGPSGTNRLFIVCLFFFGGVLLYLFFYPLFT